MFVLLAPESPRFLALAGQHDAAFVVLERIGGAATARTQLDEILATLHTGERNWRALLRPGVRRALIVSLFLAVLIHVSGINTVIDYAPAIFQSAGWKIDTALASTFLVGITELLFTVASLWMIDRFGRKPLYIGGSFGMAVALVLLVITVLTGHFQGYLVLALILAYLAFFCACIGPVFWTLVPEIFPNDVRGMAMTFPVLLQWVANALVVLLFPYAFHVIGKSFTFGFLAAMCICQGLFTWFYVPETKNKRLEEIESYWMSSETGRHEIAGCPTSAIRRDETGIRRD